MCSPSTTGIAIAAEPWAAASALATAVPAATLPFLLCGLLQRIETRWAEIYSTSPSSVQETY